MPAFELALSARGVLQKMFLPFSRISCPLFQSAAILYLKAVTNNHLYSIYVFTLSFIYSKIFIMSLHCTLQVTHFKRGKISLGSFLESPKYNRLRNVVFFPLSRLIIFSSLIRCCFHFKTTCHIIYFQSVHRKSNELKEEKKTLRLC